MAGERRSSKRCRGRGNEKGTAHTSQQNQDRQESTPPPPPQPTLEDPVGHNAAKDVDMSVSTASQGTQDGGNLDMEQVVTQKAQQEQPSSNHIQQDKDQSSRENLVVLQIGDLPEKSNTNFSRRKSRCSTSFNITEFARRFQDDIEEDPEEVQSTLDPAYNSVHPFAVKPEFAPILGEIFDRYGDITCNSDFKSPAILSSLLEHVCDTCKRLKEAKFGEVPLRELEEMLAKVHDLESQKLNVGWLCEKIARVIKAQTDFQTYLDVKRKEAENDASIRRSEDELLLLKQKIFKAQEKLLVAKAKADHLQRVALDIKDRVEPLVKHGLLW